MSNPFYRPINQQKQNQSNSFIQFMNEHRGENADELVSQAIKQFNLTQEQLNLVQAKKTELDQKLAPLRWMFGK